jgi:hypothetical protein
MLWIQRELRRRREGGQDMGRLILTVHDQVLGETRHAPGFNALLKEGMGQPILEMDGLIIPSDAKVGTRWGPRYAPDAVPEWDLKNKDEVDPLGMEEIHEST